jgi:hypothetical protein
MEYGKRIRGLLPSIDPLMSTSLVEPFAYVAAVGFEDRCFAFLNEALGCGAKPAKVIAIEYKPEGLPNRKKEFVRLLAELRIHEEDVAWVKYQRTSPGQFEDAVESVRKICSQYGNILVDISSMSKMLILQLLQGLRFMQMNVRIIYTEAAKYHPTKEEYEEAKSRVRRSIPEFLSSGIYDVVTTYSLSSVAMQGHPSVLVGFPTFNQNLLAAAIEEATPQELIIFEGIPHKSENLWRLSAIAELNSASYRYRSRPPIPVQTFDYRETVEKLTEVYSDYQYTHRFVIAPANSKFQAIGVFLFKQMHPDVHIIYPTPRGFFELHTEGVEAIWQISIDKFARSLRLLRETNRAGAASAIPR